MFLDNDPEEIDCFAHDIRGLLSCVQLEIESLRESADDRARKNIGALENATNRIVDYCAAATGNRERQISTLSSLNVVLLDVTSFLKLSAGTISISCVLSDVNIDLSTSTASALHRMLMNLGRNAIAAINENGGSRITISAKLVRDTFRVDIIDDGPGLSETALSLLFPRLDHPIKNEGRVRLGLASTIRLANSLDGDLYLLRSNRTGATFRIVIPIEGFVEVLPSWLNVVDDHNDQTISDQGRA